MLLFITFKDDQEYRVNGRVFNKDTIAVIRAESLSEAYDKAYKYFECYDKDYPRRAPDWDYVRYPRGIKEVEPAWSNSLLTR